MKNSILFLLAFGVALTTSSCSDDISTAAPETTKASASSTAATYVSIYADKGCEQPLVENAPLTGAKTAIDVNLTYGLDKVYVKYPTASGVRVVEKSLATFVPATLSRTQPGTAEYYESSEWTTIEIETPEDAVKNYVTNDGGFTNYHSSGAVMFEDTWPSKSNEDKKVAGTSLFGDFNDLVVDYDLEATVVDEADQHPDQTYREDLKVVLHIRAMGGSYPQRFGVILEGLDKQYVNSTEVRVTLGNYQTEIADPLTAEVVWEGEHPIIYVNELQKLINAQSAAANGLKINSKKRYNVYNDATLNVGKGLFTITTIFRGVDRNSLSTEEGAAQVENYKKATINTRLQNFFLVTRQANKDYEIHMQGYQPTAAYAEKYAADMNDKAAGVVVEKDTEKTYTAADGEVWCFKTPVMTYHSTENSAFTEAYPLYLDWCKNGVAENAQWYKKENANEERGTNGKYIYISEAW